MQIDSTDVGTLMSLADYYNGRRDYRSVLDVTQRLFDSDQMPLDAKIKRFEHLTSDMRFYREYYIQLNALASTLAVRYPQDRRVVELYAKHLIASGELEQALALYKLHLDDQPPVESYYRSVIDIESYLQHPDSATLYITGRLELFPRRDRLPALERPCAELFQAVRPSDQSLSTIAPLCRTRFAARRDLGNDRRHLAPESRRGESGDEEDFVQISRKGSFRAAMKQCYKAYDSSLRYDPDNAMVLNNYAYFLSLEERDLEKALAMSSRATPSRTTTPPTSTPMLGCSSNWDAWTKPGKSCSRPSPSTRRKAPRCWSTTATYCRRWARHFMAEIYWRKALEKGYDAGASNAA